MVEEHLWPDLPPVPPWVLHDGDAALGSQENLVAGTARVWFTLREKPTVRYAFTSSGTVPHAGFVDVSAGASDLIVEPGVDVGLVAGEEGHRSSGWHSNGSMSEGELKVEGDTKGLTGGDGSQIDLLRMHLVNFGENDHRTRQFDVDGWTLRISPTGSAPMVNGFVVTHVLDVSRSDDSVFDFDATEHLRNSLFFALAFATGRIVGSAVAQGHRGGTPVYLEAKCTRADPWKVRRSWWDQRSATDDDLAELCRRWVHASRDDRVGSILRRAAGDYVAALTPEPLDTAVPIAGIGVELMVWELIHQRDQLVSTAEFDRLSFASRLRLALDRVGVASALPADRTALPAHASGQEVADGPWAFGDVRNRLVHPPKKQRSWPSYEMMTEAWWLGIEYLALLVLAALGYGGRYRSQFAYTGWVGDEIPVPWCRPTPEERQ